LDGFVDSTIVGSGFFAKQTLQEDTVQLSRSEQKRRLKELEKLVSELARLPKRDLARLPCDAEIRTLLEEVAVLKGGARKRQIKYVTKLLRRHPADALYDFLSSRKGAQLQRKKEFHELEYLRDALVNEAITVRQRYRSEGRELEEGWSSRVLPRILEAIPGVEGTDLLRLARLFAVTRNNRHSREIFRLLQAAREQNLAAGKRAGMPAGE